MSNDAQLRFSFDDDDAVGYRGPIVTKIVGITYRQLDYWDRTELVQPSVRGANGSGTQRLYSFDDVVALKVVRQLIDTGVSLQKIRAAINELRRRGRGLADSTLVSDGHTVFEAATPEELFDLIKGGQGVFAISIAPVVEELRGQVLAFPTERLDNLEDTSPVEADGNEDDGLAGVVAVLA